MKERQGSPRSIVCVFIIVVIGNCAYISLSSAMAATGVMRGLSIVDCCVVGVVVVVEG